MTRRPNAWILLLLSLGLLLVTACDEADDPAGGVSATGGGNTLASLQEGINLSADPVEIRLDPNDPNAPTDPGTGQLTGSAVITAMVLDADLNPLVGVDVTFATTAGALDPEMGTTDDSGNTSTTLTAIEDDAGDVEITATAGEFMTTLIVPVVVVPLNTPPVADAGPDQTVECPTPVLLDGSASSDVDSTEGTNDHIVSFEWSLDGNVVADGEMAEVELPTGTHVITLTVTDVYGAQDTDEVTITVEDTTPPVVNVTARPKRLWPPNHKMRDVYLDVEVEDACDEAPMITLVSVESNEPDNGTGDGDTANDIQGVDGGDDRHILLRAERAGPGMGRVYTITYSVVDAAGNETMATTTVRVPHDMGHDKDTNWP
jgi:hypothetical protein